MNVLLSSLKLRFSSVRAGALALTAFAALTAPAGALTVVINPGATLAANTDALAAFNRAGAQWGALINDPITVTISANFASLGANILGSTSSVSLAASYTSIRNAMVADNLTGALNTLTSALPTAAQFSAFVPTGSTISGNMTATKANLKALGFTGLDAGFGATDATMTFSTNFGFDFDNSNGVSAGLVDFETVAVHEIGHALGFVSGVDNLDGGATTLSMRPLDLFRFGNAANPNTLSDFTFFARDFVPGAATFFDQITPITGTVAQYGFSTGANLGDGRQASHWKDDALTGAYIGIMDPTLGSGTVKQITRADLVALDVIGWNINYATAPVPEAASPLTLGMAALFLVGLARSQRVGQRRRG